MMVCVELESKQLSFATIRTSQKLWNDQQIEFSDEKQKKQLI